jgi:hypothetical protein
MIVIDTRCNKVYTNLSLMKAGEIIGVNKTTVLRWKKKRTEDGSHKEVYNSFEVYFDTCIYKQASGGVTPQAFQFKKRTG